MVCNDAPCALQESLDFWTLHRVRPVLCPQPTTIRQRGLQRRLCRSVVIHVHCVHIFPTAVLQDGRGGRWRQGALRFGRGVDELDKLAALQLESYHSAVSGKDVGKTLPELVQRALDVASTDRAHDREALFEHTWLPALVLMVRE